MSAVVPEMSGLTAQSRYDPCDDFPASGSLHQGTEITMLRRLSAILLLTTVIVTLLPASSSMAQIIPNPIATPKPGGAPAAAPGVDPGAPSSVPPAGSPEYGVVPH